LLDQGEGIGYVQDHLGHSSIQVTMDIYRHKIKKHNQEAAEKLGGAFFEPNGCKMGANEA
jgi:integrase